MARNHVAVVPLGASPTLATTARFVVLPVAALAFCAITYGANHEIQRDLDRQIAHDEGAFCQKIAAGPQYGVCMQGIANLVRQVDKARAIEF